MKGILHRTQQGYYMLFDENKQWIGVTGDCDGKKLKLSKQNCDEIFGVVDVEKLAYENTIDDYDIFDYNDGYGNRFYFNNSHKVIDVYMKGFNKAAELQKDKLFTEADMIKFADDVYKLRKENKIFEGMPKLLQSLQQPTEIEVEIEMDICGDKVYAVPEPKLDENGCLILKKK
jgi:hypothetical protein